MLSSRSLLKGLAVTSAAIVFAVSGGSAALADDIYNNLDATIDAAAESMTLTAGGSAGSTVLAVSTTNNDGKNGCNLTGSSTLVTAVNSSNASVATVSPSSVTFDSCGATRTISVTPLAAGTATISLSLTSNNSGGTFDLAPATFVVTVNPVKSATTTTVSCPASVTYSGAAQTPCTATVTGSGGFSQSATVSYSDNTAAGTATASASFAGDSSHLSSSGSATFAIAKASSTTTVTCPASVTWTGAPITPCSAKATGAGGLDQTLSPSYADNTAVGTATASASFAGDANHTVSSGAKTFSIDKAGATVTVSCTPGTYTYTGSPQAPCTAKVTGTGLDQSLPVSYDDNVNAGTVTASASFAGDATHAPASGNATFTIGKATAVCSVDDYTGVFDGSAHGLSGTCTGLGGADLSAGLDLGDTFTDAGQHTAHWTFTGGTNYAGQAGSGAVSIGKASSTTVVTCPESVSYDGAAQEPCTAKATGPGGLSETLPVDYSDNTDAGTATASAAYGGDDNHTGSDDSASFEITKADTETTVTCPDGPFVYTSNPITPACTATTTGAGGLNVSPTVTFGDNVNAGVATASASYAGDSNHNASSGFALFTIDKADSTVTLICDDPVTYTGLAMKACSASASGVGLGTPVPLLVDYSDNTDAGTAGASAAWGGDANHNGSSDSTTFTILPAPSTTVVTCPTSRTFTGAAIEPCTAAVTGVGGLDESLTVTYENNTHAGTATASASYAGDANHKASHDSATFTIDRAPSTTTVTCTDGPFTYDGSPFTPCTASVTGVGGLAKDLAVGYTSNTGAGTATASASYGGDDDHLGSADTETFVIDKATSTTTLSCPEHVTFVGLALTPCSAGVTGAGGLALSLAVAYGNNTHAGTATASATFAGDANHEGSGDSTTFTIDKAPSTATVTCTDGPFTYDGSPFTPCTASVTGVGGLAKDLEVGYSGNTGAGTATASASYGGDDDHLGSADTETFVIDKATSTTTLSCPASVTFSGDAQTPCSATVHGAGGLVQTLAVIYGNNVHAGTATASATFAGDANHEGSGDDTTFTIDKAPTATTVTCPTSVTYTGSALTPCSAAVTGAGGLDEARPVTYSDNTDAGSATASASYPGDADHLASSGTKEFTIAKADSTTTVTCPTSVNYTGSAITPCTALVTGAGGLSTAASVSYSDNVEVGTANASAGYAGDSNHNASSGAATFAIAKWWTAKGFYQPVDMGGVVNTVKAGSTVPLKFELFAGPTELTATTAVKSFTVQQITCSTSAPMDDIELTTTGGTSLRYDTTGGQYIQNWQTPKTAGTCYRVTMTAKDTTFISAVFKLK